VTDPENKTEEYFFDGNSSFGYHRDPIQLNRPAGALVAPTTGARKRYVYSLVGGVKGKIDLITAYAPDGTSRDTAAYDYSNTLLKPTAVKGADGNWKSYEYNSNGTLSKLVLPKASYPATDPFKIHHTYQPNGTDIDKIQRYLDGTLRTLLDIDYYSGTRDIQQTNDALARATTYAWHPNGLPQTITDQTTGDILSFDYDQGANDADGDPTWRLLRVKRNAVLIQQTEYDPIGRPGIQTDSAGDYVQSVYDGLNRLQRADFSDDSFIEHIWECCFIGETRSGKVVSGQDRVQERTKFFHDGRGLLIRSIDTAGRITRYGHDDAGRMTTLTDPLDRETEWTFDGYGRPDKKIYPDDSYEQTIWKTGTYGVIDKLRNRAAQEFTLGFDANGNPTTFTGPGVAITRTYDGWDRLDTIKDTAYSANVHNYDYDLINRVTQLDGPWTNDTIGWQYLDTQRKIIRTTPGGVTETIISDTLGRLASIANPLGTYTPGYDGDTARLLTTTHSGGFNTAYTYHGPELDSALHTITSKLPGGNIIAKHTYGYDSQHRINSWKREATLANPSGVTRSYEWTTRSDFASQLTSVAEKSLAGILQGGWDYVYDPAGNINTVQTSTSPANPASITNRGHNNLNQITTYGGGGLTTIRGTLDEPGKVSVGIAGSGDKPARMLQSNRFEAELPLEEGTNSITVAAMDGNYNRSDYTFSVEVAARSATNFSYDTNGNLESDGVRGYEWDSLSRLKKITWAAGKTTEFKYNALGQRCERIDTDGATISNRYHLFDGIRPLDMRVGVSADAAGIVRRYFEQGEQRGGGSTWTSYHYCRDHLGSIREVVGASGSLQARYDYDPYGKRITQYQASTYGGGGCEFGYTGHVTQPSLVSGQTELVMTLYRAYDPELGRWLSPDPIEIHSGLVAEFLPEGPNLYSYVGNHPLGFADPDGHTAIPLPMVGVAGLAVVGIWAYYHFFIRPDLMNSTSGEPSQCESESRANYSRDLPRGYWEADKGAEEWGRRSGAGAIEGRRRFHELKGDDTPSGARDRYGVNPETGDVCDPEGEDVGNLGE
jgi:RHS repeat-associated protein